MPADHLLAGHVLKGAQIGPTGYDPVAVGQGQIGDVADSDSVRLGRLGLVEQSVLGALQPVGRVRGARRKGLGLQRAQAPPTHGHAQAVTADAIAFSAQSDLQSARTVAAFMAFL